MGDEPITYEDARAMFDALADEVGEWQGFPVPVENLALRLCKGHPMAAVLDPPTDVRVIVGGPDHETPASADATADEIVRGCLVDAVESGERLVNEWYDARHNRNVCIFQRSNGRAFAVAIPRAPDRSMERATLALNTMGASDAWDLAPEYRAREKLAGMLSDRQWRHYELTGSFIETSQRSRLTYVFRRLRPTVVMTPRSKGPRDWMRVLAVLCLHPIGYYDRSWAGCLTPTDDVIAHLLLMRGDEAGFWRHANQHDPASPEAGL